MTWRAVRATIRSTAPSPAATARLARLTKIRRIPFLGGDGDDHLFLGQGDAGIGGAGADTFESGSYIAEDADAPVVTDFDPAEDRVQISVDLEATPDPEIAVVDFADGTGADVVVDGTTVLRINGAQGLDPDSILVRDMRLDDLAETA